MKTIGNTIRELRIKHSLLIRELALEIGVDSALLSKYENGYRLPTRKHVINIAKYFKINESEIVIIWLSDKIVNGLSDETNNALKAMKVAEKKFKYLCSHRANDD